MRLSFLLLALVAAATAYPQLQSKAGNVDTLKKNRDVLLLLQQISQDILDKDLCKIGREYKLEENLQNYNDQGVVKYLIYSVKLGHFQRKGAPWTVSISNLRKEIAVLTKTLLCAKDYSTFIKTAAWARTYLNEAQFVKAFVSAVLQRPDTRNIVTLPTLYEVLPNYFFDTRVINKALKLRAKYTEKIGTKNVIEIPVDYSAFLPKGEHSLAYFTQDIGLNNFYGLFSLAGWMTPHQIQGTEGTTNINYECDRCEIGRGAMFYYIHQQLLARYKLERMCNNLMPIKEVDFAHVCTPFKPHLSFLNGLEFPGRNYDVNLLADKDHLVRTAWRLEKRIKNAIDSGFVMSTQGSLLALFDRKGLDMIGNIIESTGRSVNPRFYGTLQGVTRELLGGALQTPYFFDPLPSALELGITAVRDPVFYKLYKRIIYLFKRYQDSLPMYKEDDLLFSGVTIEDVKVSKLVTYCDKFKVDIDAATIISTETGKENVQLKAVVDRLNHKPFDFEIVVQSNKPINGAVVRVYIGPKFDFDGKHVDIKEHRLDFVELDQFIWNIKEGKTLIKRRSIDAPMRSVDGMTKKELFRQVEGALNSHQPFYPAKIAQMTGFPERLALPKGKRSGFPLKFFVIISSPKAKTLTYGPVVSPKYQIYQNVDFENYLGDYAKKAINTLSRKNLDTSFEMESGEMLSREMYGKHSGEDLYTRHSGERDMFDTIHGRQFRRTERSIEDSAYGMKVDTSGETLATDRRVYTDVTTEGKVNYLNEYYKDKHVFEMIGGAISLDGRPLGYPFDRRMTEGCLFIPNIKVVDVNVYYEGKDCNVVHTKY